MFTEKNFYLADTEYQYKGMSNGILWNGWQMPYFPLEVGKQLADTINSISTEEKLVYNEDEDCFIHEASYYDESDWERYEPFLILGIKYYPIGAGSWTWDAVE